MGANDTQIGGDHYKNKGECPHCGTPLEHWDIAWAFQFNMFQYIISKWIFRRKGPEGRHLLDDLKKIIHATEKYMEVVRGSEDTAAEPLGQGYVNQDGPYDQHPEAGNGDS